MNKMLLVLAMSVLAPMALVRGDDGPSPRHDGPPGPPPRHEIDHDGHSKPPPPHDEMGEHGPPDHGRDRDRRGGPPRPLTPEEVDVALDIMARIDPETAEDLRLRHEENPRLVGRALVERFPRIRMFLKLREFDPDMFELRVEDIRLARLTMATAEEYREARADGDAEAIDAIEARLLELLAERFELRQRIREREIADLEERLAMLREQLEEQADRKDAEIEKQFERITEPRTR